MNTKELVVIYFINNEQIDVILKPEYPGSSIYHILVNKELQGQACKVGREWRVFINENSLLEGQDYDAIIRALENSEYLNN